MDLNNSVCHKKFDHLLPRSVTKIKYKYETAGTWHYQVIELVEEIGQCITNDPQETTYLLPQLSVAFQRGNTVSFQSTIAAS